MDKEKHCFKCGQLKSLMEFYKHPAMGDGHLNKCKDCTRNDVKKDYDRKVSDGQFREKERTRGRLKYRRLYVGTGKSDIGRNKKWDAKYPEKADARRSSGKMKKPFAEAEKHHWSYNSEHFKDVVWLTKRQHKKAHRFLIYDQDRKMYRRFDNNELLDNKMKHEYFIKYCIIVKPD